MAFGKRAEFDSLRESDFGSITTSYTPLGNSLNINPRIIGLNNDTNANIYVSFDGIKDHVKLTGYSDKVFDIAANKIRNDGFFLGKRRKIYVKYESVLATFGSFWIELVYGMG